MLLTRADHTTLDGLHQVGDDPPLVLLHGASANHTAWAPLLPHLGGVAVLAPSYPGRLGSTGPARGSVAELAATLGELLAHVGRPVVLAGHSLGGAVALELTLAMPERVLALVMIASGARLRVHPAILAAARSEPDASDWRACDTFDRLTRLAEVRTPTTIVHGTRDPMTPTKYQDHLVAHIAGARRVCLDGAGHDVPRERPAELAAALREARAAAGLTPAGPQRV